MTDIKAIPTIYSGVHFRSRLEARWAAFFDLLGWKWEYEPIDLNGYIPDFIVSLDDTPFLFEVKPIIQWPCAVKGCTCGSGSADERAQLDGAISKIEASGWKDRALVVGAALAPPGQLEVPNLGIPVAVGGLHWSDTGTVITAFVHPYGREYGLGLDVRGYDGESSPLGWSCSPFDPTPLWREAGNRVQWRPGKRKATPRREDALPPREVVAFLRQLQREWEND